MPSSVHAQCPVKRYFLEVCQVLEVCLEHACSSGLLGTGRAEELHFLSFLVEEGVSVNESVKWLLHTETLKRFPLYLVCEFCRRSAVPSSERSLSKLKMIKNYLRSRMKLERL